MGSIDNRCSTAGGVERPAARERRDGGGGERGRNYTRTEPKKERKKEEKKEREREEKKRRRREGTAKALVGAHFFNP